MLVYLSEHTSDRDISSRHNTQYNYINSGFRCWYNRITWALKIVPQSMQHIKRAKATQEFIVPASFASNGNKAKIDQAVDSINMLIKKNR